MPSSAHRVDQLLGERIFGPLTWLTSTSLFVATVVNAVSGQSHVALLFLVCSASNILNWSVHREGRVTTGAVHRLLLGLFVAMAGANLLTGGFGLPAHFAMGLVPGAAVMMAGLRFAWPWAAASVAQILLISGLHAFDYAFIAVPPPESAWLLQTAGALVTFTGVFLLAAVFEIYRQRDAKDLATALRAAESSNRSKSLFLANVSHELRTPMNGVLGMLDALLGSGLNDEQQGSAQVAHSSAQRLLRLLNTLLDLTRIEMAELELHTEPVDPIRVIKEVIKLHEPLATAGGLQLAAEYPVNARDGVLLDPLRMSQVLTNLLSNAIKFTEHGQVTVKLSCSNDSGQILVAVQVRDSGPGLSDEDLSQIFEPFGQADSTTTRAQQGAGLGLSIARSLCEAHGGNLTAESRLGEGATFTATFLGDRVPLEAAAKVTADIPLLPGLKVLVAEDDLVNRMVVSRLLKMRGLTIEIAEDGHEAVSLANTSGFDLILMDWHMPLLDGLDATRQIRLHEDEGRRVPIVALTASTMPDDRALCLEAGMDDFMSKPIMKNELDTVLRRWLVPGS